jgi:hypothetical protein
MPGIKSEGSIIRCFLASNGRGLVRIKGCLYTTIYARRLPWPCAYLRLVRGFYLIKRTTHPHDTNKQKKRLNSRWWGGDAGSVGPSA